MKVTKIAVAVSAIGASATAEGQLAINVQAFKRTRAKEVKVPVNHVVVVDCSGSMSYDLPKLRKQLCENLLKLVKPGDTITLMFFSGRGQHGVIVEGVEMSSITNVVDVHQAITKKLVPIGMTGFVEPLQAVVGVVERISKARPGSVFNMLFQTDGYDNQWREEEILNAAEALADKVEASTIVEYGYYCNRPLLAKMADKLGATLIFNEGFGSYVETFKASLNKSAGAKRVIRTLESVPAKGYVVAITEDGDTVCYPSVGNKVALPETVLRIAYATEDVSGAVSFTDCDLPSALGGNIPQEVYALLGAHALRMDSEFVYSTIRAMGDVGLAQKFINAFTKQDFNALVDRINAEGVDAVLRFADGRDFNALPKDDAFTVIQLLDLLVNDDAAKLHVGHEAFSYNRIGGKAVTVEAEADADALAEVQAELAKAKTKSEIAEATAKLNAIMAEMKDALKFEASAESAKAVPVSNLTFSSERANVSVLVKFEGSVKLDEDEAKKFGVPNPFPTHIYRNFAIVKDGILNMTQLPLSFSKETFEVLKAEGLVTGEFVADEVYIVDFAKLPVINRKMVQSVSADKLFRTGFEVETLKGAAKVFNTLYKAQGFERTTAAWTSAYTEEAIAWLKENGIDSYNGFSPKVKVEPLEDPYVAPLFKLSFKGLSSLPTLNAALEAKLADKAGFDKLKISEKAMFSAYQEYLTFVSDKAYQAKPEAEQREVLEKWLTAKKWDTTHAKRKLDGVVTQMKVSLLLGKGWFTDLAVGENTLTFDVAGFGSVTGTVEVAEAEIKK